LAFDMHDNDDHAPFRFHPLSLPDGVQPPNSQKLNRGDMLYECPDPTGARQERMPCLTWETSGPLHYLSAAPRSRHVGGVQTVYVDGHVGFLSDNIDYLLMAYLICVDDGIVTQPPQ
jgi:prepilin-type processing-associated H-X9-DG protein